ncbi:DUF1090 family protein [Paracidovorax wautersii]|uniref:DUF1090 domain-containing protein n=1 Tax=Paracidovorax wautersii TaxID=1177982 RepID=A0ABU1IDP1_9BURK|nr:DUF1090 family protein [Paracidovorax wautersii]MDR6215307.1 hypothetical protein [Paracidovorax wautersii]
MKHTATPLITRLLIATAATLAFAGTAAAQPADPDDCQQKRAGVTAEVEQARAAGQDDKVRTLERTLAEFEVSCTEPGEKVKRERRISQAEKDVTRRRLALEDAQRDGKADTIAKRQAELKKAQDALAAAKKSK